MKKYITGLLLLPFLLLAACEQPAAPAADNETASATQVTQSQTSNIQPGIWRATLQTPGGDLPFLIELIKQGGDWQAYYINGKDRVPVITTNVMGDEIVLASPILDTRITAQLQDDGSLQGQLAINVTRTPSTMPFSAVRGEQYRFFKMFTPPQINVDGRWAVTLTNEQGDTREIIGEFDQQGSQVTGTFLTPYGDYRYMAGAVRDNKFYFSTFDGGDARLFVATMGEDGKLHGGYWANGNHHETFVAVRDANATLPDPTEMGKVADDAQFNFSLPNLQGETVSLSDPRFDNKVVIVTFGGSWCPNCHDEAVFLDPWYQKNKARGVEVVQIMIERVEDKQQALQLIQAFDDKYTIPYPILFAGTGATLGIQDIFPALTGVFAYPTTLFIDKQGQVRKVHVGFTGPGTGKHFDEFKREFNATVDKLLAE
ncbi:MAG TPA: TlpA disulfide reductase family protein [Gammaproteobacteria bacterium]|nr:TlpA disulfide reductase family protein [Gammaproteobacteria bacterium]